MDILLTFIISKTIFPLKTLIPTPKCIFLKKKTICKNTVQYIKIRFLGLSMFLSMLKM